MSLSLILSPIQFDSYGTAYGMADVIGCYLDLDSLEIWYTKNGENLGKVYLVLNIYIYIFID